MKMLPESRFPFRYLFINCFPFQFSQGEFRPAVIRHVLSAVGIDSHHIHFQKTVIITVHFGRIDRYSVAAFDYNILHTRILENLHHIREHLLCVVLQSPVIGPVLP